MNVIRWIKGLYGLHRTVHRHGTDSNSITIKQAASLISGTSEEIDGNEMSSARRFDYRLQSLVLSRRNEASFEHAHFLHDYFVCSNWQHLKCNFMKCFNFRVTVGSDILLFILLFIVQTLCKSLPIPNAIHSWANFSLRIDYYFFSPFIFYLLLFIFNYSTNLAIDSTRLTSKLTH